MPKYIQFYEDMIKYHKVAFDSFKIVHDNYALNPRKWKAKFDEEGRDIQDIIRRYENLLCSQSESSGRSKFTTELASKFQSHIKKHFPKIDFIGAQ